MTSLSVSNKKSFGNCKVEWQIDNFSLQTYTKEWFIQSPEFTINGSEETKWGMYLRPKLINGSCFVLFNIKRSAIDSGPKYTWLKMHIHCKIKDSNCFCFKNKLLSLKKGSKHKMSLGSIEHLLSQMNKSDDLLTIVCRMIVYSKSKSKAFRECEDSGLKLLSKNMLDLYTSSQNFDTKFVIGDNVILAHKAILSARNEYISSIIEDDDEDDDEFQECTIIDLSDFTCDRHRLDYKAMRKVLAYLYTGDIRHAIEEPSFAVFHCASVLEISEIELHYKPDKLILKSTVDFEEYAYILHGYEFENSHLIWHCYTEESTKTFRLLLYPERNDRKDYISLFTKTFEKSMFARLEFDFIAESGEKCIAHIINNGDVFLDVDKVIGGIIKTLDSSQNTFQVNIKIKLTAGIKLSYIDDYSTVSVSCINEDYPYECLSRDLDFLLNSGPFTDTIIDNNGMYFWVHKCILASRCRLFSDILEINEEGEAIVIPNFHPHIVYVILTYLYSGVLIDVTEDEVIQVYKAAAWATLFQLKSMCSDWLKVLFKSNRNIRCRVVRTAEECKDSSLMKSILNDLFVRKEMCAIPTQSLSFEDVSACRFCLSEH